jgi:hypothetical protein
MNTLRRLLKGVPVSALGIVAVLAYPAMASDLGQAAADQVSEANYIDLMDNWLYTHAGDDRGYGPEHDLAMDNIALLMESYGLTVALEPFSYSSTTYYNVVGTKTGTVWPDQEYVIGAHYDCVSNPGADDDASGVALMLEVARVVCQYDSDYTIRFAAFDREEQGLVGSTAYVDAHISDDILGMLQADMVAYDPGTDHARVYGSTDSNPIKNSLLAAIAEYGDGLTAADYGWISASNHAPFDYAGFQACLLIEGEVWSNPYYHTQQDSFEQPGNLNFPYAVKMTRSAAGWLVDQAGVQVAPLFIDLGDALPWRLDPDVATSINVQIRDGGESYVQGSGTVHYRFDGGTFLTAPLSPMGGDQYEAVLPGADCGSTAEFYFSAAGDGGGTLYEPEDAPGSLYTALVAALMAADDFEGDQGWTVEDLEVVSGRWERGVPAGDGSRGDATADFDGSGQCYLTGNDLGNTDVDGGPTRLISPTLNLGQTSDAILRYAGWFSCDDDVPPAQDFMDVELSNDGGASWTLVHSVASTEGWFEETLHIGDYVALTPNVKIQFSVTDNPNNSITEAAIDAFFVVDFSCDEIQCAVRGDLNGDTAVNGGDIGAFVECFLAGDPGTASCVCADIDGSGVFDVDDASSFVTCLLEGACP